MTNFYGSEIYLSNDELLDTTASRREEDMMLDELSGNENDATEVKNTFYFACLLLTIYHFLLIIVCINQSLINRSLWLFTLI